MSETEGGPSNGHTLAFCLIVSTAFLPGILAGWLLSLTVRTHYGDIQVVSPARWFLSTCLPIFLAFRGLQKSSLSFSGAITALFVGFALMISNYCFCTSLIVFFLTSSKLTKFRADKKKEQEEDYKHGGSRNWIQVLCNAGFPTVMAVLYMLDYGSGESLITFQQPGAYTSSWLSIAVLGSIACACGDTWASEIGSVMGDGHSMLITTGKKVPAGVNGGVTAIGTIASALGGMVVGITYYATLLLTCTLDRPQWPVVLTATLSGLFGSIIDSVFGATLQYSGINDVTKKIVSSPGTDVKWISGVNIMNNHSVNAVTCFIMGALAPFIHTVLESIFSCGVN